MQSHNYLYTPSLCCTIFARQNALAYIYTAYVCVLYVQHMHKQTNTRTLSLHLMQFSDFHAWAFQRIWWVEIVIYCSFWMMCVSSCRGITLWIHSTAIHSWVKTSSPLGILAFQHEREDSWRNLLSKLLGRKSWNIQPYGDMFTLCDKEQYFIINKVFEMVYKQTGISILTLELQTQLIRSSIFQCGLYVSVYYCSF